MEGLGALLGLDVELVEPLSETGGCEAASARAASEARAEGVRGVEREQWM